MYYDAKVNNTEMPTEQLTLDQITEKENTIKELNDKSDELGK